MNPQNSRFSLSPVTTITLRDTSAIAQIGRLGSVTGVKPHISVISQNSRVTCSRTDPPCTQKSWLLLLLEAQTTINWRCCALSVTQVAVSQVAAPELTEVAKGGRAAPR